MKSQKEVVFGVLTSSTHVDVDSAARAVASLHGLEWTKQRGATDPEAILAYSRELVCNWMRKDPRLNGGVKRGARLVASTEANLLENMAD